MYIIFLSAHSIRSPTRTSIVSISGAANIGFRQNSKEDSYTIFRDAAALNMTEAGYVWIVTEQALNANNTPDGVIGLQLVHAKSEKNHIRVSVNSTKNKIISNFQFLIIWCRHCRPQNGENLLATPAKTKKDVISINQFSHEHP